MQNNPTGQTQGTYDLLDAFKEEGCPICALGLRSVAHYIESINYDSVGDPGVRQQLKAALGFCNLHAYQWLHAAFILGTADIYQDVVRLIADDLRARSYHACALADRVRSLFTEHGDDVTAGHLLRPSASCPACAVLGETEDRLTKTLVYALGDGGFRAAYVASAGHCVPHLRIALSVAPTAEAFATLRDHALQTEETLLMQLAEIIRKHDYRYRYEPTGVEKGAAARAVAHVAGAQGIAKLQVIK